MIVALSIVTGFKNEITNKVAGFGSHIQLRNFDNNQSYEETPMGRDQPFLPALKKDNRIKNIQAFASKAGIIKTKTDLLGVVLKGIDTTFDASFFADKMVQGSFKLFANDSAYPVIISQNIANKMKLKLGDNLVTYFIEQPPRIRKFTITGIYNTGLEEFDDLYAYCRLSVIQKLNNWSADEIGGYEITVKDLSKLEAVNDGIYDKTGFQFKNQTIKELYPEIFHWLELQDVNVVIIILLMVLVAGINMISTLLILILENTTTIGLLKALGSRNSSIRKIFLYLSGGIMAWGLLIGNVIGIALCLLQKQFHFITLPQESYYVSYVPINFSWSTIFLINAGTMVACLAIIIIPSMIISRIDPVKSLRYE